MKRIVTIIAVAAAFAAAAPAGQAAYASYNGPYGWEVGRANTEYFCLGNGTIQVRAYHQVTDPTYRGDDRIYFRTVYDRWNGYRWDYMGLALDWQPSNLAPTNIRFTPGFGTVRFRTQFYVWRSGQAVYTNWLDEFFFWSNGQVFGDGTSCRV